MTMKIHAHSVSFFFFNDTATTEIYTLSLHDALPICGTLVVPALPVTPPGEKHRDIVHYHALDGDTLRALADRKSTRLNSSHSQISYAVFCLKKKKRKRRERSVRRNATRPPASFWRAD